MSAFRLVTTLTLQSAAIRWASNRHSREHFLRSSWPHKCLLQLSLYQRQVILALQLLLAQKECVQGLKKSVLQLSAVQKPSPMLWEQEGNKLLACHFSCLADWHTAVNTGTGKPPRRWDGTYWAGCGNQFHQTGDAPDANWQLSQGCACRAAVQERWAVACWTSHAHVHGGCFTLLLHWVSGCCSASGGLRWLGRCFVVLCMNKPRYWECLNLLMLLQVRVLNSLLEIIQSQDEGKVLVFLSETLVELGRIPRGASKSCLGVQSSSWCRECCCCCLWVMFFCHFQLQWSSASGFLDPAFCKSNFFPRITTCECQWIVYMADSKASEVVLRPTDNLKVNWWEDDERKYQAWQTGGEKIFANPDMPLE